MKVQKVLDDYSGELLEPEQAVTLSIVVGYKNEIDSLSGRTERIPVIEPFDVSLHTLNKICTAYIKALMDAVGEENFIEFNKGMLARYKNNYRR